MKCRAMSKIHKNQPNSAQKKALRDECEIQFDKLLSLYNRQVALQVMHILRFEFGFGQKRLRRFSEKLAQMQIKNINRYEAKDDDIPYICEIQLRESGINVDEFLKEGETNE